MHTFDQQLVKIPYDIAVTPHRSPVCVCVCRERDTIVILTLPLYYYIIVTILGLIVN